MLYITSHQVNANLTTVAYTTHPLGRLYVIHHVTVGNVLRSALLGDVVVMPLSRRALPLRGIDGLAYNTPTPYSKARCS